MNDKLPHAIFGSVIAWWVSHVLHWFHKAGEVLGSHDVEVARWGALVVTVLTGWAAVETALCRRKQRKKL